MFLNFLIVFFFPKTFINNKMNKVCKYIYIYIYICICFSVIIQNDTVSQHKKNPFVVAIIQKLNC